MLIKLKAQFLSRPNIDASKLFQTALHLNNTTQADICGEVKKKSNNRPLPARMEYSTVYLEVCTTYKKNQYHRGNPAEMLNVTRCPFAGDSNSSLWNNLRGKNPTNNIVVIQAVEISVIKLSCPLRRT